MVSVFISVVCLLWSDKVGCETFRGWTCLKTRLGCDLNELPVEMICSTTHKTLKTKGFKGRTKERSWGWRRGRRESCWCMKSSCGFLPASFVCSWTSSRLRLQRVVERVRLTNRLKTLRETGIRNNDDVFVSKWETTTTKTRPEASVGFMLG